MKKKSIFVVALAALMLIAFTACEQPANIWNPNGKVPTALNITQNEPFVEGQLFDASKFSVEVVYQDGSKETTTSANVTLDGENTTGVLTPGAVVSASLTTVGANAGSFLVSNSRTIDVRTIDSVTVVAPATLDQNANVSSVAVKSLFTVTANYEGGSVVVKPAEFELTLVTSTVREDVSGTIGVKFASDKYVATSDTFTIDIVDPDEEPVEYKWASDKKLAYAVADGTYIGRSVFDPSIITLYKAMTPNGVATTAANGDIRYEEVELGSNDTITYTLTSDTAALDTDPAGTQRYTNSTSQAVTFVYRYADETGAFASAGTTDISGAVEFDEDNPYGKVSGSTGSISITVRPDYPMTLSLALAGTAGSQESPIATGSNSVTTVNLAASNFKLEVASWKSGYPVAKDKAVPSGTYANTTWTFAPAQLTNLTTTPSQHDVSVTFADSAVAYVDAAKSTSTLTVWAKAGTN